MGRHVTADERAVIDRLDRLRKVLPVMAAETVAARREAARLRTENIHLLHRLAELETSLSQGLVGDRQGVIDV